MARQAACTGKRIAIGRPTRGAEAAPSTLYGPAPRRPGLHGARRPRPLHCMGRRPDGRGCTGRGGRALYWVGADASTARRGGRVPLEGTPGVPVSVAPRLDGVSSPPGSTESRPPSGGAGSRRALPQKGIVLGTSFGVVVFVAVGSMVPLRDEAACFKSGKGGRRPASHALFGGMTAGHDDTGLEQGSVLPTPSFSATGQ